MKTKNFLVGVLVFLAATGCVGLPVAPAQGSGEASEGMNKKNSDGKAISDSNEANRNRAIIERGADTQEIVFVEKDFYREFKQRATEKFGETVAFSRVTESDIKQLLYNSLNGSNKAYAELLKKNYDDKLERMISERLEKYDAATSARKLAVDLVALLSQLKADVSTTRKNAPRAP